MAMTVASNAMTTFANPFMMCAHCRRQVTWRRGSDNLPCGHYADFYSACLSWSPVDGCRCDKMPGAPVHDGPVGATEPPPVQLPDWVRLLRPYKTHA